MEGIPSQNPQDQQDPEKLKQALKDAEVPVRDYEQFQHPQFNEALGFSKPAPTEPGKISVMVIEPSENVIIPKTVRHGEYAAALVNSTADHLSGRNIDVVYADTNPQISGFETPEETKNNFGVVKADKVPNSSLDPDVIAKRRAIYAQADVASVSYGTHDDELAYDNGHTRQVKDAWQGINTAISIAAGNDADESGLPHEYRSFNNYRVLPQDRSGLEHFAHYSMRVGAVEKNDKTGVYNIASYSSFNNPTFLAPTPTHNEAGVDVRYKFYDPERQTQSITEEAKKFPDDELIEKKVNAVIGDAGSDPGNIDFADGIVHLPAILNRAAEQMQALQPEGEKTDLAELRAQHKKGLEAYLSSNVMQDMEEEFKKDSKRSYMKDSLPAALPAKETVDKAIGAVLEKGSIDGIELDRWTKLHLSGFITTGTETYINPARQYENEIPGSIGMAIQQYAVSEKEKELVAMYSKEYDAEGYSKNIDGTSFAAPVVAGQIAALKEKHPNATNDDIFWAMAATAQPVYGIDKKEGVTLHYHESASGLRYNDTHAGFGMTDFAAADTLLAESKLPPTTTKELVSSEATTESDHRVDGRVYTVNVPEGINTTKATVELQFRPMQDKDSQDRDGAGEIKLISPKGDTVMMNYQERDGYALVSTNLFMNTDGKGQWQIVIPSGEFVDKARITVQGLEPDDVRMNRRPPQREPLRKGNDINRMTEMYQQSYQMETPVPVIDGKEQADPDKKEDNLPEEKGMDRALRQARQLGLDHQEIYPSAIEASNARLPGRLQSSSLAPE